jgi:NitT/TauT family transport system permease protein
VSTAPGVESGTKARDLTTHDAASSGRLRIFWNSLGGISLARILVLVLTLMLWQLVSVTQDAEVWLGRPTEILDKLVEWTRSGYLVRNAGVTMTEMLAGFALGAAAGIAFGMLLGLLPYLGRVLDPFIMAFYSLPKIGLAPLFILWFGIGLQMKVILTATVVFFLVFTNCYAGVRARDEELMDVLAVMGASWKDRVLKVVLPGSLSYIYVGLKLGVPYALIGAVFGEIIASNKGLGFVLISAANQFDTNGLMAALFVLMILGAALNLVLQESQRYVLRWQRIQRR